METDLDMVGNDYNLALCLFFITYFLLKPALTSRYILFEVPSNLVFAKSVSATGFRSSLDPGELYVLVDLPRLADLMIGYDLHGTRSQLDRTGYSPNIHGPIRSGFLPRERVSPHLLVSSNRICIPHCSPLLHGDNGWCFGRSPRFWNWPYVWRRW